MKILRTGCFFSVTMFIFLAFSHPDAASQPKKDAAANKPARVEPVPAVKILEEEIELLKSTLDNNYKELKAMQEASKKKDADFAAVQKDMEESKKKIQELEDKLAKAADKLEKLKEQTELTIGGLMKLKPSFEYRLRPEYINNLQDLNNKDDRDQDFFFGQRIRLGLELKPAEHLSFFIEVQDSRLFGNENSTMSNEKNIDLHQGYVEVIDFPASGLKFKAGRMELSYGSERLIGSSDWDAVGRAFDGAKFSYKYKDILKADLFGAVVNERTTPYGEDQNLYGLYLTSEKIQYTLIDLYFIYLEDGLKNETKQILTAGARAKVSLLDDSLTMEGEASLQFGKNQENGNKQDHFATAYFVDLNYMAPVKVKPSAGFFFCSASGDGNPVDNKSISFYPLFPSKHNYWGAMDLISMSNLIDYGGRIGIVPVEGLSFKAEFHMFQMVSKYGKIYDIGSQYALVPNGFDIGKELDISLSYDPDKHLSFSTGYSFFLPGNATKNALGTSDRADWFFMQGIVRY